MKPFIVGRQVTSRGGGESSLPIHLHAGAVAVAIATRSPQGNGQPVLLAAAVEEYLRMFAEHSDHYVHPAIIVQISEGSPARRHRQRGAGIHWFKTAIVIQRQQRNFPVMERGVNL